MKLLCVWIADSTKKKNHFTEQKKGTVEPFAKFSSSLFIP